MPILLTAFALGAVSMIIVLISGLSSGLVRLGTLSLRAVFAFCMTSAASYFLMMLFDLYEELKQKKLQQAAEAEALEVSAPVEEAAEPVETVEKVDAVEAPEAVVPPTEPPPAPAFQPLDASSLPNVGK